jgi:hypothetical protein
MARGSPKMKANVQRLVEERDRLLTHMTAIKNKIEGLELAMQLMEQDKTQTPVSETDTSKRGQAKNILLELLREVGTSGLNATSAVEMAERRGVKLERGTAASNLSRMKADQVITYDGDKYRLQEFTRPPMSIVHGGAKSS